MEFAKSVNKALADDDKLSLPKNFDENLRLKLLAHEDYKVKLPKISIYRRPMVLGIPAALLTVVFVVLLGLRAGGWFLPPGASGSGGSNESALFSYNMRTDDIMGEGEFDRGVDALGGVVSGGGDPGAVAEQRIGERGEPSGEDVSLASAFDLSSVSESADEFSEEAYYEKDTNRGRQQLNQPRFLRNERQ